MEKDDVGRGRLFQTRRSRPVLLGAFKNKMKESVPRNMYTQANVCIYSEASWKPSFQETPRRKKVSSLHSHA